MGTRSGRRLDPPALRSLPYARNLVSALGCVAGAAAALAVLPRLRRRARGPRPRRQSPPGG